MGIVETIGAVATTVAALISLGYFLWNKAQAAKAQKYADAEAELGRKIDAAKTNAEREKLSKELYDLRNNR